LRTFRFQETQVSPISKPNGNK